MKKAIIAILITAALLCGCHATTRSLGGDMELTLEPWQKLEEITWKDDTLWYLTRPMREDEQPEIHTFHADSEWHVWEGTVTVIESKE